jgi:nitronate monooxygenase
VTLGVSHVLAIEHPIMLAPMGSATGRKLASAVTNAGGQDMIGSGQADVTTIRKELSEAYLGTAADDFPTRIVWAGEG